MRPDPDLLLPPSGQGFPLLPGGKEELVTLEKGDGEGEGEVNSIRKVKERKQSRRSKITKRNKLLI